MAELGRQSNQSEQVVDWNEQQQLQQEGAYLSPESAPRSEEVSREMGAAASRSFRFWTREEITAHWRANVAAGHQEEEQVPSYSQTTSRNPVLRDPTLVGHFLY